MCLFMCRYLTGGEAQFLKIFGEGGHNRHTQSTHTQRGWCGGGCWGGGGWFWAKGGPREHKQVMVLVFVYV